MEEFDLVPGDIVYLAGPKYPGFERSTYVPCDVILIEGSLKVSSYVEIMDAPHQEMFDFSQKQEELPSGAKNKQGQGFEPDPDAEMILDSKRFVPMGVRIFEGSAKGICV